jgi:hypothetical protein
LEMGVLPPYLPGLASNHDPPQFSLPHSSWATGTQLSLFLFISYYRKKNYPYYVPAVWCLKLSYNFFISSIKTIKELFVWLTTGGKLTWEQNRSSGMMGSV